MHEIVFDEIAGLRHRTAWDTQGRPTRVALESARGGLIYEHDYDDRDRPTRIRTRFPYRDDPPEALEIVYGRS